MKFLAALALTLATSGVSALPNFFQQDETSSIVSKAAGSQGLDNAKCQKVTVQAHAVSQNVAFQNVDDQYSNQTYVSQQFLQFLQYPDAYAAKHMDGSKFTNDKTYKITGLLCEPKQGAKADSSLLVAVHGIGFNADYWNFGLSDEYSFQKHAASHGYSSFAYDRLGTGGSSTPNSGFKEAQVFTEVGIYQDILKQLRNTKNIGGKSFKKITGIGHSYGSAQTQAVSHLTPELLDGVVLTGFTTNADGLAAFVEAGAYTIARDIPRLPKLLLKPATWVGDGVIGALISQFLCPLENTFSPKALSLADKGSEAVTLGAYFTIGQAAATSNFTGPVHVINGNEDFPFCNSNCSTLVDGKPIPDGVSALYPMASNFSSYIIPRTGHGISPHYEASGAWEEIMSFIISNKL